MIKRIIAGTVILILVLLVMSGITFLYIILLPPVNNTDPPASTMINPISTEEGDDYTAFKNEYLSLPIVARTYLKYVQLLSRYPSIKLMDVLSDHLTLWKTIRVQ